MHRKILKNALGILLAAVIMAAPKEEAIDEEQRQTPLADIPAAERHEMHGAATAP